MERVFNLFREVFGTTKVYHVLGNHEGKTTPMKMHRMPSNKYYFIVRSSANKRVSLYLIVHKVSRKRVELF
jgi:hypothetical protein